MSGEINHHHDAISIQNMEGETMLNKLKIWIAVAVLSGTVSAKVQATTNTTESSDLSSVHTTTEDKVENEQIQPSETPTVNEEAYYIVKPGDTLWSIASVHGLSVDQLMKWNDLQSDLIQPDFKLLIKQEEKITEPKAEDTITISKPEPVKTKAKKPAKKVGDKKKTKPKIITVKATAYTAYCKGCSGITKTGINLRVNPKRRVIAVDPKVIPLGTKVYVEGFGKAVAADIGGAIKGKRIDVFIPNKKRAVKFGVKKLKVTIID
jgi:3D (Asp-Asp-Asp) domain-containing protein